MEITMKKVSELIPYAQNTKKHDQKQIENVANSIKRFGWQQPIVIDENNVVVIGHCRLLAAKKIKQKEVPCTVASGLTDQEIRELRIADNKTNESPWDMDMLNVEMPDLDFEGFEFDFDFASGENYSPNEFGDSFSLADGGKPDICQMTFTLHNEQKALIEYAIGITKNEAHETFGNTNGNGNALYEVVRQWAEQMK